ncbi:hypothetical protein C2G38_2139277 [Gigaspora rosea]|uniref:Uncharacterized protein n=1 Tax=Gigaspora rosea TaxID=44941 RepID=A0A397VPH5_9GLOM|nr:hypothetical protein C2G38_2139277 [Gigaspora rosea]
MESQQYSFLDREAFNRILKAFIDRRKNKRCLMNRGAMNCQHCTANKSVPYHLVFRQLPHCDTNLANLLEKDNYSSAKGSVSSLNDQTLISEMDLQPTIISEFNNEIENIEETYDDSDTISDMGDLQEINSDADVWYEMDNSADEQTNINFIKIEDRMHETTFQRNYDLKQNRMQPKYRTKHDQIFKPGELVKLQIPDIDRQNIDCQFLPCKIIQKMPNYNSYQIACQFGVLDHWYPASELEPLDTSNYFSLGVVPLNTTISLRQASFKQRLSRSSSQIDEFHKNNQMNLLHIKR